MTALCTGCLVNLWSVHSCALRVLMRSERKRVLRACSHQGRNIGAPSFRTLDKQFSGNSIFPHYSLFYAGKFYAKNDEARKVFKNIQEERRNVKKYPTENNPTIRLTFRYYKPDTVGNVSSSATDATIMSDPHIHNLDRHIPDAQSYRKHARASSIHCFTRTKGSKVDFYLGFFSNDIFSLRTSDNFMRQSNGIRGELKRYARSLTFT